MKNFTKYILFVFTKNDNPKEFTEQIADELTVISDVPNVNYYFGPESSVFTITTLDSFEDVKDYVDMILGIETITYILLPYTPDKLSYGLPKNISEHLFNDGVSDYMSDKTSNSDPNELEVRNVIRNQIKNDFFFDLSDFDDDDEDEEIIKIKCKKRKPTFDEVFNKLAESGVESLSQEELLILKKLSN
jgi:hypothetical protein